MLTLSLILAAESVPEAPARFDWKILLFLAGVVVLAFTMFRLSRRNRAARQELIREYGRGGAAAPQGVRDEADKIMVNLVEAGQEINAQLDTKMRVLNRLIRDAEAVATRTEQYLHRLEDLAESFPVRPPAHPDLPVHPEIPAPVHGESFDPAKDTVLMDPPPGRPTINAANIDLKSNTDSGRWRSDVRGKIEEHHREHRTPAEIARMLHLSLSEVNLVIDMYEARLRHARSSAPATPADGQEPRP